MKPTNQMNYNMIRKLFLSAVVLMLLAAGHAAAHGVNIDISTEGRAVVVRSSFAPTQPLIDALVTIYAPADGENAWQTGRTDKDGNFVLLPDAEGEWTFVVDDQKGHLKRVVVGVYPDLFAAKDEPAKNETAVRVKTDGKMSKGGKIIIGLSLIFGVTGIFYGLRAGKGQGAK